MEMVLKFNLGPIHLLDGLIDKIFTSDSTKTYLRKEAKISRIVRRLFHLMKRMKNILLLQCLRDDGHFLQPPPGLRLV